MASIVYPVGKPSTNPYVCLTDDDTDSLIKAFDKAKRKRLAKEIAKEIGVCRSYLYDLLTNKQIDLIRFGILCSVLNIKIITNEQLVDLFKFIENHVPTI
tara:strand:- start:278 stop:577 length:300 start_codon:yes stop_codon:yes gene_type:complete